MAKFWLLWCGLVCFADLLSSRKPAVSPVFSLSFCQLKGTKAFIFKCGHCSGFSGTFCCTGSQSLFCHEPVTWNLFICTENRSQQGKIRSDLHAILLLMNLILGKKSWTLNNQKFTFDFSNFFFACSECFRKHISFTLDFPDTWTIAEVFYCGWC